MGSSPLRAISGREQTQQQVQLFVTSSERGEQRRRHGQAERLRGLEVERHRGEIGCQDWAGQGGFAPAPRARLLAASIADSRLAGIRFRNT
jgi:hypothetical protein